MQTIKNSLTLIAALVVLLCAESHSHAEPTNVETSDFSRVAAGIQAIVEKHGAENTLVVFDLDNTLLAMDHDLGSDQWFDWQENLLKESPNSESLVASDFSGLLRVQEILFSLSRMHTPEPGIAEAVRHLSCPKCTVIVLTARSSIFWSDAIGELRRNNFDFRGNALRITEERGHFQPLNVDDPSAHGVSRETLQRHGIESVRPVTYSDGIFMVAGQHRGVMLKSLLSRSRSEFKAIIHVDDEVKYSQQIEDIFGISHAFYSFTYTREAGRVARFHKSDKKRVIADWRRLRRVINDIFDDSLQ